MGEFEKNTDYYQNDSEQPYSENNGGAAPKKRTKKIWKIFAAFIGCTLLGFLIGSGIVFIQSGLKNLKNIDKAGLSFNDNADDVKSKDFKNSKTKDSSLGYASAVNVDIIKKVKPAVVCITSTTQTETFFDMFYESDSSGSGIIFSKNDENVYIVTNNHVIDGAKKVNISFDSDVFIPAKLVGKNTASDLAVISVSIEDLKAKGIKDIKAISFGDSDNLIEGSSVIAIGNALGEGNIATSGVVSRVNKEINVSGRQLTVIQTDAAINPGNSGGALINSKGEVVGINTAKLSMNSVEGVGYSITANSAKPIIEKIMNNQSAPFLGVYISDISEDFATAYNLPQTGVMITQIVPRSSAAASELKETDIITGIDDKPIFTKEQLTDAISSYKIGDEISVKVIRNGRSMKTIKVKLLAEPNSNF